jgi:hypothetical protein
VGTHLRRLAKKVAHMSAHGRQGFCIPEVTDARSFRSALTPPFCASIGLLLIQPDLRRHLRVHTRSVSPQACQPSTIGRSIAMDPTLEVKGERTMEHIGNDVKGYFEDHLLDGEPSSVTS